MMRMDENEPTKRRGNPFKFQIWDRGKDNQPIRFTTSYCDDNNNIHGAGNLHELYDEVAKSVRMTGYFSTVTKLGRIGSKSIILLYNLNPKDAAAI